MARERPDLLILAPRPDEESPVALAQRLRAELARWATCPSSFQPAKSARTQRDCSASARTLSSAHGLPRCYGHASGPGWAAQLSSSRHGRRGPPRQPRSTGQQIPALFRGLSTRALVLFLDSSRPVRLLPGELLVHEDQPASGVYLIRTGTVSISITGPDGRQIHLGTAGPGDPIGELAALGGGHHSATVVALRPVVADHIPQDAFLATLAASPEAMLRLLRLLTARLRVSDRRIVELALTGLYNRVIQLLLEGSGNAAGPTGLDAASLARRVEDGSEQLRRAVMLLEAQGLVRTGRKGVEVLDPQGLRRLIGQDDAASGQN